jgi:chromosome partitioning protein
MKIVSVINYKGGVGKTTLTANLSGELAKRGYNVLMIDLDPQASLTFSFIQPDDWKENLAPSKTIKNWFKPRRSGSDINFNDLIIEPDNVKQHLNGQGLLHLISSHLELINVDLELATQLSGANLQQAKQNFIKVHKRLLNGIKQLDDEKYDIILIDCPPNFNIVTKNAIVASDYILIPAKPDYLSTLGIDYLKKSLDGLVKEYNEFCKVEDDEDVDEINPKIAGVLFTMVQFYAEQPISATRPFIAQTKKLGIPVFESYMRENKTLFADAPQYGVPVVLLGTSRPDIVEEIKDFIDEFESKIL